MELPLINNPSASAANNRNNNEDQPSLPAYASTFVEMHHTQNTLSGGTENPASSARTKTTRKFAAKLLSRKEWLLILATTVLVLCILRLSERHGDGSGTLWAKLVNWYNSLGNHKPSNINNHVKFGKSIG